MKALSVCLALIAITCVAKFAPPRENVPLGRLIKNASGWVTQSPNDLEAKFLLARLHSMAFAQTKQTTAVYFVNGTGKELPPDGDPGWHFQFSSWTSVQSKRELKKSRLSPIELAHLTQSLDLYRSLIKIRPSEGIYHLGLGWMLEQSAPFASQLNKRSKALYYLQGAASQYKLGYDLCVAKELRAEGMLQGTADRYISQESAQNLLRLATDPRVVSLSATTKSEMQATIGALEGKMGPITPVAVRIHSGSLLSNKVASFDLSGRKAVRNYAWISSNFGLFVWDPSHSGKIFDGRQLFGSGSFSMLFSHGYKALRALDDNRDGILRGQELKGIRIWRDCNENGVSDRGEVRDLDYYSIQSIATQPDGKWETMMTASRGAQLMNGRFLQTVDWIATQIARPTNHAASHER